MNDECSEIIKKVIEYKNKFAFNCTNNLPTTRYCSQNNFDLVIVGGKSESTRQVVRDAFTVDGTDFFTVDSLPIINYGRSYLKTVCIKGQIYVFGGIDDNNNPVIAVEKYSSTTNTWNFITQMYDNREGFCACSFIDSIYVIGGYFDDTMTTTNFCLMCNITNKTWTQVARMNEARCDASCVVFEGRIVVTGGFNINNIKLNTVEAYDHIDDSWTNMPNMVERRQCHKSIALRNKLFLVGRVVYGGNVEVFDSHCNKFVLIKEYPNEFNEYKSSAVLSMGNKIVIFSNEEGYVLIYDVDKNKWSRKSCEATKNIVHFSCPKLPK